MTIDEQVTAVSLWIRICEEHGGHNPTSADADHSSLLRRLLSGEQAFSFVPPRRYSYPDYRLAAGEPVKIGECFKPSAPLFEPDVWIVDQARYRLIEHRGDGSLLLEWPEEPGSRYEVSLPDEQGFRTMQRRQPVDA